MKNWLLPFSLILGLTACAEKDSNYAKSIREQTRLQAEAARQKTSAQKPTSSADLCEKPQEVVCSKKELPLAEKLRQEGHAQALESLKKKHISLPSDFSGSDEDFEKLSGSEKYTIQKDLLVLSDEAYRLIYDYDQDLNEAAGIVKKLIAEEIKNGSWTDSEKERFTKTLQQTNVLTISEAFTKDYPGKDTTTILVSNMCGSDGLHHHAHSTLPPQNSSGFVIVCPGILLKQAGHTKEERLTSLISLLGHEFSHHLQFQGLGSDDKTLSCLQNTIPSKSAPFFKSREQETNADIWGYRVLMAHLKDVTDVKIKKEKISQAMSWVCDMTDTDDENENGKHLQNKDRIENLLKMKETQEQLSCSSSPQC